MDKRERPASAGGRGGGASPARVLSLGRCLFRYRSWTALPLVAFAASLLVTGADRFDPGGLLATICHGLSPLLVITGVTLRVATLARVPAGACGRGRRLSAPVLVTWGTYAWTRNPLYLGNFLLVCGLLCEVGSALLAAVVIPFFAVQYGAIVVAEEAFLRDRHGAAFDEWAARVPRWLPRVGRRARDGARRGAKLGPEPGDRLPRPSAV